MSQLNEELIQMKAHIRSVTHDMNNALSVIQLEIEQLAGVSLEKKLNELKNLVRELQLMAKQS